MKTSKCALILSSMYTRWNQLHKHQSRLVGSLTSCFKRVDKLIEEQESFTRLLMDQLCINREINAKSLIPVFPGIGWTKLIEIEPNLYAKLEGENYSGSSKDRAILSMIYAMYLNNKLKQNDTLCLVTSGSAAKSLLMLHELLQIHLDIEFDVICVIPSKYKEKPIIQSILNNHKLYNNDQRKLIFVNGLFVDILKEYKQICKKNGWILIDQHYDYNASIGHRITGLEIKKQINNELINDIIVPTGTGATMTGIKYMFDNNTYFHSRKSLSSSSTGAMIDGLSDVNKYNNFCDSSLLNGYNNNDPFDPENALKHQQKLKSDYGIEASLSSGASYWLAKQIQSKHPKNKIVFICPDGKRYKQYTDYHYSENIQHTQYENIIIGGGPIGSSTAMFLSQQNQKENTLLICDDKDKGSYQDWSKILRLSLDSNINQFNLSKHSYDIIEMLNEIRSTKSGHNIISIQCGVLFVASPNTDLANKCLYALNNHYDDDQFKLLNISDIKNIFNITLNLPKETLCFYHPRASAINPIELVYTLRGLAQTNHNNVQIINDTKIDSLNYFEDEDKILIFPNDDDDNNNDNDGTIYSTKNLYLFCGARNKELLLKSKNFAKELEDTYLTAISTIRYNADYNDGEHPIILGQLNLEKSLIDYQANFSVIPEIDDNGNNVLKTRLSGKNGYEVIENREGLDGENILNQNEKMIKLSKHLFGELLPYIDNEKPLDFNRCCTYRNHYKHFNGTSLLNIPLNKDKSKSSSIITTVGCYGVGVRFGPVLGEAAVAINNNQSIHPGISVFNSGDNINNKEINLVEKSF